MHKYLLLGLLWFAPLATWATASNAQNSFGFLGGSMDDDNFAYLENVGAGWMRPHPGPAVWEMIQSDAGESYDWDYMDTVITTAQSHNIRLLITIWPFAAWDQVRKGEDDRCQVANTDEFLPNDEATEKGRTEYIPGYRCNPYDWDEYEAWVKAMVERYDGDGKRDMPGLTLPVRDWEVMNEPDLPGTDDLDFYKDGIPEYYQLLRHTFQAIRRADRKADVLIAGAAGSSTDQPGNFLDFYRQLFSDYPKTKNYFTIGNIHHVSPEGDGDFNVSAYQELLDEFNIDKSIWVTEAGAQGADSAADMKQYIKSNTRAAIAAGAEKLFFIHYQFGDSYTQAAQKRAKKVYKKLISSLSTQ